jgi:6-phosphogluconate dehydrogenase
MTPSRIGIVGAGSMGAMMALAFAERGLAVSVWDVATPNLAGVRDKAAEADKLGASVQTYDSINDFCASLDDNDEGAAKGETTSDGRVFVFSITHGDPADSVLDALGPHLRRGDTILDGGNEHYRRTEARQQRLAPRGVAFVGMGVSGGYQAARHGPSMSPGGDRDAIARVMPLLEKYAARDAQGEPCVAYVGPAGSGHFVKMAHNGIEQGMISILGEAWDVLRIGLGMGEDEIGEVFRRWNEDHDSELRGTYLVEIGAQVCRETSDEEGEPRHVIDRVLDKVVQDDDDSEGTGAWTLMDAAARHVAAPTISAAHDMRIASGNRAQRVKVAASLSLMAEPGRISLVDREREGFVADLRRAVFAAFLCSFAQGLELIARASRDEGWAVSLATCLRIWRAGCIVSSRGICASLLEPALRSAEDGAKTRVMNVKLISEVAAALRSSYASLKTVVGGAVAGDHVVPALAASLEYVKYVGSTRLPTRFEEAELDLFGAHGFDEPQEGPGRVKKGRHHYEWRPV